ncbi:MAG: hypothetical protein ACLFO5_02785 [Opitutales bacterium]
MEKRNIKLNLKLPAGVSATSELQKRAAKAAQDVVNAAAEYLSEAKELSRQLAAKGIKMSPEELLERKTGASNVASVKAATKKVAAKKRSAKKAAGKKVASKKAAGQKTAVSKSPAKKKTKRASARKGRKRVTLSPERRNALIEDLKGDMKIAEATQKYGVSPATVMNIKSAAGLTKARGKK